jgi:sugar/nucleoside kinase (ribokinase family)
MNELGSAVVAGHICLDVIPDLDAFGDDSFYQAVRPGRLIEAGAAVLATGGPVSNAGIALHILGVPTRLVSRIGDDYFGRIVRELVESCGSGLADGLEVVAGGSTAYSLIFSPPGADRLFLHHAGAVASFGPEDIDFERLERVSLLHFGYPPLLPRMFREDGRELAELLRRARERGVTTSLDTSYPDPASESGQVDWRAILETVLPHVDVFEPSLGELLFMLRRPLHDELARRGSVSSQASPALVRELGQELIALGAGVAAIKLGERGLYLKTGTRERTASLGRARPGDPGAWAGRELWAPCFRVEVAGTTGAGDATGAGLLAGLLHGLGAEQSLTAAVAAGACAVERADALSGLRGWQETLERVRSGWPRLLLELDDPAWEWDEDRGLWTA